jgi:hypothetical protein
MFSRMLTVGLFLALATPLGAQDRAADEKAIRAEVEKMNAGRGSEVKLTDDSVFWSGALVRPVVRGGEKPENRPGTSNRTNQKTIAKIN